MGGLNLPKSWECLTLTNSYVELRHFRHGGAQVFLCLSADSYIGQSVAIFGEYSEAEVDVFRWFVRPDDIVIDAGALFGAHTIALAGLCPEGTVLAFEPQRIPFQILCANAQLNSMSNVDGSKCALGAEDGISAVQSFDPRSNSPWGLARLRSPYEGETSIVRVRTIDSLALKRLDFLKIDVEGWEAGVLIGGRETIQRCLPVIYLEFNENRDGIVQTLRSLGYQYLYRHQAPVHRFPNFNMVRVNDGLAGGFMPPPSDMVLAVPPHGWAVSLALPPRWAAGLERFLVTAGFERLMDGVSYLEAE